MDIVSRYCILQTIFSVGFWSQNEQIKHPELRSLFNSLSSTILDAPAKSTVEKYAGYFKRFVKWAEKYSEIKCVLPCQELYVGLYLQNLMQSANHYSVIESAFYGIKWAHNLAGVANPCDSEMVRLIVEALRRKLNRPIEKKSPVTSDIMIKLFSKYNSNQYYSIFFSTILLLFSVIRCTILLLTTLALGCGSRQSCYSCSDVDDPSACQTKVTCGINDVGKIDFNAIIPCTR
ncbi:unnamed protein product [Mytilus coruscus]|uniref:Uncharacterized protein n=1 Tax=Mytilus coruscus TaxID=42192 RepID=A0A6J8D1S4_MYTCO|nr:unnamed protein product [Mytilus coruscus]